MRASQQTIGGMYMKTTSHTVPVSRAAFAALLLLCACSDSAGGGRGDLGGDQPLGGDGDDNGGNGDGDHGGGDGNDSGSGDGDSYYVGDGDDACQAVIVKPQRVSPHMLILFDRSASMEIYERWDPSVDAVKDITGRFDEQIQFGLMAFPNTAATSNNTCDPATTPDVAIGLDNGSAIAAALDDMDPGGYTPTAPSLEAAASLLGSVSQDPDAVGVADKYVLLVTDGAPNCHNGQPPPFQTIADPVPESVTGSVAAISAMTSAGIKTYVIGYDTQNSAKLRAALDQMAAAGGTGDVKHRAVEDEESLSAAFQEIAGNAVTCTYALEKELTDVSKVSVKLDDVPLPLNGATTGWTPTADNRQVTITGEACAAVKSSAGHTLSIVETCDLVIVL